MVEEKLDGALRLQSRGHILSGGPRERQFAPLKAWAAGVSDLLWSRLADRYVLFGEWLFAKHTVFYDALPHYFAAFDLYDTQQRTFVSTPRRNEMLAGAPVVSVPVLFTGVIDSLAELTSLIAPSTCRTPNWLYRQYCEEQKCLAEPRVFPSSHSRFVYFRTAGRDPEYLAYDDTVACVTVLSGLPGAGKDHWIKENRPDLPVVSLDAIRANLHISPTSNQGRVLSAAREQARTYLRSGLPFVWNATNVSRQIRDKCVGLIAAYRGRVEIVSVEAAPDVLYARNGARAHPVPDAAMDRLVRRWEAPDPTEAHAVTAVSTS